VDGNAEGFIWTRMLRSGSLPNMEIDELKSQVEKYREKLKEKKGHVCTFGKNGPVGMVLIDALVEVLEAQQQRIEAIEKKASS